MVWLDLPKSVAVAVITQQNETIGDEQMGTVAETEGILRNGQLGEEGVALSELTPGDLPSPAPFPTSQYLHSSSVRRLRISCFPR